MARAVWLFDGVCVLCSWGVHYTLRHERDASIQFVAIQSAEGRALAARHGVDPDDPVSFLFIDNGHVLQASDAVIALSRHLKGPARVLPLFRFVPKGVRDATYGLVARNRYRLFGKTQTCMTPQVDVRDRFVL